jgi:hypothetical protein
VWRAVAVQVQLPSISRPQHATKNMIRLSVQLKINKIQGDLSGSFWADDFQI